MIDSNSVLRTDRLTDIAFELGIEPEAAMHNIFISRVFNHSQTYDLVMTKLDSFFGCIPARLLFLPGFADIYYREGVDAKGKQHLTHMAHGLITFSLKHEITTIIKGSLSPKFKR
jgi:hypothetical protein